MENDIFAQTRKEGYEFLNSFLNEGVAAAQQQSKGSDQGWMDSDDYEGELSIDVYQTEKDLVIKSAIAGIRPEDIDISISNDMLTIRGKREMDEEIKSKDYFYRECYWGRFSRSIILPLDVEVNKIKATIKNGILTIRIPKSKIPKSINVTVKEEE